MISNSCNECIYKIEINSNEDKCIKQLPKNPVNLNSILMKNIITNTSCDKTEEETSYCTNENNGYKDFINGEILPARCKNLNRYGECRYFKSLNEEDTEETE